MQDHAEQATVDHQTVAIAVIDKAQLPELIHEMTDPRTGCAHHLCKSILTDSGQHRFSFALLSKMSEQQEDPRQTLFARVEKLIHKIRFVSGIE